MPNARIATAVAALCEAFNRQPTPVTFAAYEMGLQGLADEQVEKACALALQRCKFMPVPAELRELAGSGGQGFEAMAERAWEVLRRAIQRLGGDSSVNFADGAINATVRLLGGWIRVCEIEAGDELDKWFRKEFIGTYIRVCKDGASVELRRYHGGRLERDNARWDGVTLAGGATYRLGDFGSGVESVGVDYQPLLPAPEPNQKALGVSKSFGLDLKKLPGN